MCLCFLLGSRFRHDRITDASVIALFQRRKFVRIDFTDDERASLNDGSGIAADPGSQ